MPISLFSHNRTRRDFLAGGSLLAVSALASSTGAADSASPWFALLADTHIDADSTKEARGTNMAANLKQVVAEILAEPTPPEFAIVNGDCAYLKGLKEDYATLRPLVQPLLDSGVDVHLTMGNHDDRAPFYDLFPEVGRGGKQGESSDLNRHVTVVESADANWVLVDTLQVVNKVTGELGAEQREWLSAELDRLAADGKNKPAIVVGHHYPQYLPEGSTEVVSGLADTIEFMDLLRSKPQVKAYIYGHSHNYAFKKASGDIHLINQPPVAYLFDESRPNGWLRAELSPDSMRLELHAIDVQHPQNGEVKALSWRQ
jgi:predicted phosphodiesterase